MRVVSELIFDLKLINISTVATQSIVTLFLIFHPLFFLLHRLTLQQ